MARKGGRKQLKRGPAPALWPIHRKEAKWTSMTRPGSHSRVRSFPLVLVVREILRYAKSSNEATRIISTSGVKVDQIVRRDPRFPVGLMDVVNMAGLGQTFRVLPKPGRGLSLSSIREDESGYKLCRILGKNNLAKGAVQIRFHDGRNLVLDPRTAEKDYAGISVGAAMQIALPSQKILRYLPLQQGSIGLVTGGKNEGLHGRIVSVTEGSGARPGMVKIETGGNTFETLADYVLPVGVETSMVVLES